MADDLFRTEGADALLQLGKRLNAAGGKPVVKELQKALQTAAKPITPAARAEALRRLPTRGGLAARVAKAPIRTTARVGRTTASVRVTVAGKKSGAYGANVGVVRHPVFFRPPRRLKWVEQKVTPGWFDDPAEKAGREARQDIVDVMVDFAERLTQPLD